MSVRINYSKKTINKSSSNLVLFTNDKYSIGGIKKNISSTEFSYISDLLKSSDVKKKFIDF